jgi:phage tail tape-measure protein
MANEVKVKLTVEEKQAIKAIAKLNKSIDKFSNEAVKDLKKVDTSMSSFKGNLAAMAASGIAGKIFGGITAGIKSTVAAAAELEVFETQFKTMLGSTKAAQDQLQELQEFAATTPFQLPGLASSTRQLLSFGIAQKDIIPTLQTLGDIAAGVGAEIGDLTIPFGRLQSTQKLTLIELDKFADRGVNIFKQLSLQTGVSLKNIRDDISKGKIPFEEFTTAIQTMTDEGGIFFKGMEAHRGSIYIRRQFFQS